MTIHIFDRNEEGYFQWMESNPNGFVANTGRTSRSPYFFLHGSGCPHICRSESLGDGAFTGRQFIKVCSLSQKDLRDWGRANRLVSKNGFSRVCETCLDGVTEASTNSILPFIPGTPYSRFDVLKVLGLPQVSGGDFFTGYTSYQGDFFLFCGVGVPGRTGHDYDNHFAGDELIWFGKTGSKLRHPQIRELLDPSTNVYIFYREGNRDLFTFAGIGSVLEAKDSTPVEVRWSFANTALRGVTSLPEEVGEEELLDEGAKKTITVNAYERNPVARDKCLANWGLNCVICDFNFEAAYGDLGKGFIHVHHLKPLGESRGSYKLDPVRDLRPVCPNCHAMLHRTSPALGLDQLIQVRKPKD